MNTLLEVCCGSADDVIQAAKGGADRVELNSSLFHGGLTPSVGSLIVSKRETNIKIIAMVRPREGGFCYTDAEFACCIEDAKAFIENGADGLVFGFLHEDGTIDIERTKVIADMALSAGREAVFHRAFDVVPDWKSAMDTLVDIGITRILTSGQESEVSYGTDTLREMIEYANGRIQILPGGGINLKNVQRIIDETGTSQIHLAAHKVYSDTSTANNRSIFYGGCLYPPEDRYSITDADYISAVSAKI